MKLSLMCLILSLISIACTQEIFISDIKEKQANDIQWYLQTHKIKTHKIKNKKSYDLTLTPSDFNVAWQLIRLSGLLPHQDDDKKQKESQWWMTQKDKDLLYLQQKQQETQELFAAYPGVFSVQTLMHEPKKIILIKALLHQETNQQAQEINELQLKLKALLKDQSEIEIQVEPLSFYPEYVNQNQWSTINWVEILMLGISLMLAISGVYLGIRRK
jgi:hypothetical protein